MLGVARYRLEGNFMPFLTCVMTRDGGTGNLTYTVIPLGSPGTPFVGRYRMEWFKNWQRATHDSCTWS